VVEEQAAMAHRIESALQVRVHLCHVRKWLDFFPCGLALVQVQVRKEALGQVEALDDLRQREYE
jgi:hypothetical protein